MSRKHTIVHIVSFIAIVIGLFSPILSLPVIAEDTLPAPQVTLETGDGTAVPLNTEDEGDTDESTEPEGEGGDGESTEPKGEGAGDESTSPEGEGEAEEPTEPESETGDPVIPEPEGEGEAEDSTEATDGDESDQDLAEATDSESVEMTTTDEPEEIAEPTTGRGPARDSGMMRSMNTATSTELEISMTADPSFDVTVGTEITYTITVTNNTGTDQHYTLVDTLPAGVSYVGHTVPYPYDGDYCNPGAGVVNCGLADGMTLYTGWSDIWTIAVIVLDGAATETTCPTGLVNTVTGNWGGTASANSMFLEADCTSSISIQLTTDTPVITRIDQEVSLTFTVTNSSTVDVIDMKPEILHSDLASIGAWTISPSTPSVSCGETFDSVLCESVTIPGRIGNEPSTFVMHASVPVRSINYQAHCADGSWELIGELYEYPAGLNPVLWKSITIDFICAPVLEYDVSLDNNLMPEDGEVEYTSTVTNVGLGTLHADSFTPLYTQTFWVNNAAAIGSGPAIAGFICIDQNRPNYRDFHCGLLEGAQLLPDNSIVLILYVREFMRFLTPVVCDEGYSLDTVQLDPDGLWTWANEAEIPLVEFDCGQGGLEIQKTVSSDEVDIGDPFYYGVFVGNTGDVNYTGSYSFTDELPAGIQLVDPDDLPRGCEADVVIGVTTIECAVEDAYIPAGGLHLDTYVFDVVASWESAALICEGKSHNETVEIKNTVTGVDGAWNPANRTDSATTEITCSDTPVLHVSVDPPVLNVGDVGWVTTKVTTPTNAYVQYNFLVVFSEATFDLTAFDHGVGWLCIEFQGAVVCQNQTHLNTNPNADSWVRIPTLEIEDPTDTMCMYGIGVVAVISLPETGSESISESVVFDVNCQELAIDLLANDSAPVGEAFDYIVTVTNDGSNDHGTYTFVDTLPEGIELVEGAKLPNGCDPTHVAGRTLITCTSKSGPGTEEGDAHEYVFNVRSSYDLNNNVCGTVTNTATGTVGQWGEASSDTFDVTIECRPELTLEKSVVGGATTAEPGDTVLYTLTVGNSASATASASDIEIADTLPPGFIFDAANSHESCNLSEEGDVVCTIEGPLDLGNEQSFPIAATITTSPTSEICRSVARNYATITSHTSSTGFLMNDPMPVAEVALQPICNTSSNYWFTPVDTPVVPGEDIAYELLITTSGNVDLDFISTSFDLPELPDGSSWLIAVDDEPIQSASGSFEYTLTGDGPAVTHRILVYREAIPADLELPQNQWCTSWDVTVDLEIRFTNLDGQSSSDTRTVQVNCTGLDIEMEVAESVVSSGGEVEYTITVANKGNTTVSPLLVFQDIGEAGSVFSNWRVTSEDELDCGLTQDDNPACTYLLLNSQESVVLTVTADAPVIPEWQQCGPVESHATFLYGEVLSPRSIMSNLSPPYTPIHSNTVTVQLDCQPRVDVAQSGVVDTGDDDRVDAGDVVTYTIDVINAGNIYLYDIVVTPVLEGIDWQDDLTIDALAPGESVTITGTYVITQDDIDAGQIESITTVDASLESNDNDDDLDAALVTTFGFAQQEEETPADTSSLSISTVTVTQLIQEPGVSLVKSSDADGDLSLGGTVTYSFTITNTGNVTLTGLDLIDELDGVEFSSTTISDLAPGESTELTATYIVVQPDVDAGEVENCAEVTAIAPDESTVTGDDCVTNGVAPVPTPTISATPTVPATPDPTAAVSKLPETGSGGFGTVTPVLWIAAALGIALMSLGGAGIRRRT